MRLSGRYPARSILAAVLVIGLVGALVVVPAGSSAQAGPLCTEAGRAPRGEQQQDATLEYRRIWRRAARLFGSAGQPPPRLRFVGPDATRPGSETPTWTGPDKSNCRTIFIAPAARRLLARSDGDLRARRLHRAALRWSVHETVHYFQSDEVLSSASLREYGATEWEKAHSPMLLGTRKKRAPVPFNQWRDRDQFGANYGGNPQTFIWPTAAPRARPQRPG